MVYDASRRGDTKEENSCALGKLACWECALRAQTTLRGLARPCEKMPQSLLNGGPVDARRSQRRTEGPKRGPERHITESWLRPLFIIGIPVKLP